MSWGGWVDLGPGMGSQEQCEVEVLTWSVKVGEWCENTTDKLNNLNRIIPNAFDHANPHYLELQKIKKEAGNNCERDIHGVLQCEGWYHANARWE